MAVLEAVRGTRKSPTTSVVESPKQTRVVVRRKEREPQAVVEVPDAVLRAFLGQNADLSKVRRQGLGKYSLDEIMLVPAEGSPNRLSLMDNQTVLDWEDSQRGKGIEKEKIYAVRGSLRFTEKRDPADKGSQAYIEVAPTSPDSPRARIWIGKLDDATRYRIEDRPESYQIAAAIQIDNNRVGKMDNGTDVYYGSIFPKAVFHISNPDRRTQRRLTDGAVVVLDGQVTKLNPEDSAYMTVDLLKGGKRRVLIGNRAPLTDTDELGYTPEADEQIELHNEVIVETRVHKGRVRKHLTNETGLAIVTQPNWVQDREYQHTRNMVGVALDKFEASIDARDYREARYLFADLRQRALTADEIFRLRTLESDETRFPRHERPFITRDNGTPRNPNIQRDELAGSLGRSPEAFTPRELYAQLTTMLAVGNEPPAFEHVAKLIKDHPDQFGEHAFANLVHEVIRQRTGQLKNENPNTAIHVLNSVLPELVKINGAGSVEETIAVVSESIDLVGRIQEEELVLQRKTNSAITRGDLPVISENTFVDEESPIIPEYTTPTLVYDQYALRRLIDLGMHTLKELVITDNMWINPSYLPRLEEIGEHFEGWASFLDARTMSARVDWQTIYNAKVRR